MMIVREIILLLYQAVLFGIGMGTAGLSAHLGGALIAGAFGVDDVIPAAVIFFAVAALLAVSATFPASAAVMVAGVTAAGARAASEGIGLGLAAPSTVDVGRPDWSEPPCAVVDAPLTPTTFPCHRVVTSPCSDIRPR